MTLLYRHDRQVENLTCLHVCGFVIQKEYTQMCTKMQGKINFFQINAEMSSSDSLVCYIVKYVRKMHK